MVLVWIKFKGCNLSEEDLGLDFIIDFVFNLLRILDELNFFIVN